MTSNDFRSIALNLPKATEGMHMGHVDFRAGGKIFATLGYPDEQWGVVKLSPVEQKAFIRRNPAAFVPAKGAWGLNGSTQVQLKNINRPVLKQAIAAAWNNVASKARAAKSKNPRKT